MWWFVLACSTSSPELRDQAEALASFREARAAMEAGKKDDALAAMDRAMERRPADVLLRAWKAEMLVEDDLDAAIRELDAVAAAHPRFGEARYNRAAYLARAGRVEEAGAELKVALELGVTTVSDARGDPDFSPHLAHPALAHLQVPIQLTVAPTPEKVFRGSELVVSATVVHDGPFHLSAPVSGSAAVTRSVEDRSAAGVALEWTVDTLEPGTLTVGPFVVTADGQAETRRPAREIQVVGPPTQRPREPGPQTLQAPSAWAGDLPLHRPTVRGATVVVKVDPTERVEVVPRAAPGARHELRAAGQPEWVVWTFPSTVNEVVIRGAGGERFRGAPVRSDAADPAPR